MGSSSDQSNRDRPATLDDARARIDELEQQLAHEHARREAAQNNERCFRELAEHIQEVFWMTNPAGDQLVYISPAYEHIWGQTCESLYADPGRRLAWVHDQDREQVLKAFKRDARNGDYDEIYRIDRPDGEIRWIRDRAFPVNDDDGELYRLAGFALDITERIEANDRISRLHTTLDGRERMSAFAALGTGLAHDISQPLTAARNYIAQARGKSDPATLPLLEKSDGEIARAVDTLRHLRDFAREGKPTLETQKLAPLIHDVHELLDPALRHNNIEYEGPDAATVEGIELPLDRIFAQQVLRNLLTNASDAYDDHTEGPRRVRLTVNDKSETVDIEIADNGSGVEPDANPFEPFSTTKDAGLGLGLSVSRSLARSHGGDLVLADRGGNGSETRFVLTLPRGRVDASEVEAG